MIICKGFISLFSILSIAGCQLRSYNDSKSSTKKDESSSDSRIDPRAFNAFKIWQDGEGEPIYSYPNGYNVEEIKNEGPDGVFYVDKKDYWEMKSSPSELSGRFIAQRTANIKKNKDDGSLSYPANKQGKKLDLSFTKISAKKMTHPEAVKYCQDQKLRLPTIRELFDFCSDQMEPVLCQNEDLWSASLQANPNKNTSDRNGNYAYQAWYFNGVSNYVDLGIRVVSKVGSPSFEVKTQYFVRCVGTPWTALNGLERLDGAQRSKPCITRHWAGVDPKHPGTFRDVPHR